MNERQTSNAKRLVHALANYTQDLTKRKELAHTLNYLEEQIAQDAEDLEAYINELEERLKKYEAIDE